MARKKRRVVSHSTYSKMMRRYRRGETGEKLSKERKHIPVKVLEGYLAAMPRHQLALARLIQKRKRAGE